MKLSHYKKPLDIIRQHGFKPIAVCQLMFEDTNRSRVQILSGHNVSYNYEQKYKNKDLFCCSFDEIESILREGVDLLSHMTKGTTINQKEAKEIYQKNQMGYTIHEYRLDDKTSVVTMKLSDSGKYFLRDLKNIYSGENIFLVTGKLGKELNMCD